MKLLLIRHAAAVVSGTPGIADAERPLTADGETEFRSAAGGLAWIVDPPDVLLSSPHLRARATADIAARAFGRLEPRIELALAHGPAETVLAALAAHGATATTTIGVVGHEPLLSAVLARLLGVSHSDWIAFEKGGVALVDLPAGVLAAGRLVWFLEPRILRTLGGRRESAAEGRIRERTLMGALGAARVRALREGTTLRRLLPEALRDYAAGIWTPRRDAKAREVA
jgi:phosphohistidine phosphatase